MVDDIKIRVSLESGVKPPIYQTFGASGFDFIANLRQPIEMLPGERFLVPTGIRMELPQGYEVQIRPRSGLVLMEGVTVLNTPGTIDSDYRGEIKIILYNAGNKPYTIYSGDRIAQGVLNRIFRANFEISDKLEDSHRADGGFGSTGR